jgi:hypothetical protein
MMTPQEIGFESEEQQKKFMSDGYSKMKGFEFLTEDIVDKMVPMLNELLTEDFLNKATSSETFEEMFNKVIEWRNSLPQEELKKFEDLVKDIK